MWAAVLTKMTADRKNLLSRIFPRYLFVRDFNMAVLSKTQKNRSDDGDRDGDFSGVPTDPVRTYISLSFQDLQNNIIDYVVTVVILTEPCFCMYTLDRSGTLLC